MLKMKLIALRFKDELLRHSDVFIAYYLSEWTLVYLTDF